MGVEAGERPKPSCPAPLKLDHLLLSIFDGKEDGYGEEEIFG